MSRKTQHDEGTKIAVVLEGLKGETCISETCRKYGISDSVYYRWRDQFIDGGKRALGKRNESPNHEMKRQLTEYETIIGKMTIENQILKKTLQR